MLYCIALIRVALKTDFSFLPSSNPLSFPNRLTPGATRLGQAASGSFYNQLDCLYLKNILDEKPANLLDVPGESKNAHRLDQNWSLGKSLNIKKRKNMLTLYFQIS